MDREALETTAKLVCSPEIYYSLCDTIDETTDEQLQQIIDSEGDYSKELKIMNMALDI